MRLARALFLGVALVSSGASAQAVFEIDSASRIDIPSLGISANFPNGGVPVQIESKTRSGWAFSVRKSDASLPPWSTSKMGTVTTTLVRDIQGFCTKLKRGDASCTMNLSLLVAVDGNKPRLLDLQFTTENASTTVGGKTASGSGKRLDSKNDAIELVAAGSSEPGLGIQAAQPYTVRLVGKLKGLN